MIRMSLDELSTDRTLNGRASGTTTRIIESLEHVAGRVLDTSRARLMLVIMFAVAFGLRTGYALLAVDIDPIMSGDPLMGDAASYDRIARSLMAGGGYGEEPGQPSAFWPPLYPVFLAGMYSVLGYELIAARIVNGLFGAFVPILIYLIGIRLFEHRIALLAAAGAALYPLFIVLGAWVIPDGPYILFVCLILLIMIEIQQRPRATMYVALGVTLGLAYLLKPVTAFFLPFLIPWFLLSLRPIDLRERFMAGIVTALVLIVVLTPWTVRNYVVLDSPIVGSSNGGYTFYGANNPDAFGGHYEHFPARIPSMTEGEEQMHFYRQGLEWIRSDPSGFLWVEVQKFRRLASPLSISSSPEDLTIPGELPVRFAYTVFLLLAFAGMVMSLKRWRWTGLLLIPLLGVLLSTAVFYGDARYTMPAVPVLLLWASFALVAGWDTVRQRAASQRSSV
jgi:4-amino-4-deoxy-L-arabinose transferase-like glycosyltransferase